MVESALRGVVREALARAAANGLPGAHHFYITFRTRSPGIRIPDYLATQYPDEMTIVLEHQFWDLEVTEPCFAVTLSFQNRPERLVIPFESITAFADPAVKFGLQFQAAPAEAEAAPVPAEAKPEKADKPGEVVALDTFRKK
ncbi:MAG TPA: ClpXP protease specificity-enhancing factor SspB [Stellaceae bacterium]